MANCSPGAALTASGTTAARCPADDGSVGMDMARLVDGSAPLVGAGVGVRRRREYLLGSGRRWRTVSSAFVGSTSLQQVPERKVIRPVYDYDS